MEIPRFIRVTGREKWYFGFKWWFEWPVQKTAPEAHASSLNPVFCTLSLLWGSLEMLMKLASALHITYLDLTTQNPNSSAAGEVSPCSSCKRQLWFEQSITWQGSERTAGETAGYFAELPKCHLNFFVTTRNIYSRSCDLRMLEAKGNRQTITNLKP